MLQLRMLCSMQHVKRVVYRVILDNSQQNIQNVPTPDLIYLRLLGHAMLYHVYWFIIHSLKRGAVFAYNW